MPHWQVRDGHDPHRARASDRSPAASQSQAQSAPVCWRFVVFDARPGASRPPGWAASLHGTGSAGLEECEPAVVGPARKSGARQANGLALWALCHDPEPSRALRRTGCGGIQPAKNRMGFAQGCFLCRTANLEGLTSVFEEEILGQRFRSGPIRDGRNGVSDAHRFVAGLDLDRERPCLASHARFAMLMEDRSSPDWVGA